MDVIFSWYDIILVTPLPAFKNSNIALLVLRLGIWYNIYIRGINMGNIFDDAISAAVMEDFEKAENLDDFLERDKDKMLDIPLSEYLNRMLYEKDLSVADVVNGSGLTKSYVYQIFSNERKYPSREKLLAIGFGLKLKEVEMQRMLRIGGCSELYIKNSRDAAILYCVREGLNLDETNGVLYKHDMDIIDEEK